MSHRVTDEMVDAFRRAYREWWKAATPIPLGEAVSVERDAVVAGLRAAFGVPVPSEPRCRHCGRSVHQPEPGSYPPGVDWVHEGFTISSTERGNRWCASGKTTAEPRVPEEETRTQVDPASLGVDDLTGAERDAFVALAEHRGEQA